MKNIIEYETKGTCSKYIRVEIENDTTKNIDFFGGCDGNLKGIKSLVLGENINTIIKKLKGITCGAKPTSCPDQLAVCLEHYIAKKSSNV